MAPGIGRRSIISNELKTLVVASMPMAKVSTATSVTPRVAQRHAKAVAKVLEESQQGPCQAAIVVPLLSPATLFENKNSDCPIPDA